MFLIYLLLISLIVIEIMTQTESTKIEQTEFIPVRVDDREVEAQRTDIN